MQFSTKLVAAAILLILTGCTSLSSINPFSKSETKNAPAVLEDFKPDMAVKSVWTSSVGASGPYLFSPIQVGSDIYAAAADGTIVRLNSNTGHALWRINAGISLTAGVGANSTTIAVAGQKGVLLAFDLNGKLRWKIQASSEILTAPVIGQGLVIVRSIDNRVAAYDVESGVRKWAVNRPLPSLTLRTVAGVVLTDQLAIVALPGGKLIALSLNNGGLKWEASAADPKGATELERIADVSGTPAVIGQVVCTAAYQGRVSCFDLASGAVRWSKNLSSEVGVSVDERFVFAVDNAGAISAYSRVAGSSVWRNDKLAYRRLSAPTSFGRAVAVGDAFGYLHFLSREDGSFIGRVSTDGSQILAAPIVADSNLIVQTKSGTVVAFATE
ncbi:MAG: outer membrane protein assembly factor BamB [Undibacterium sp.]|uniref:outer membrane protein assembly factor BamB n=1 Tax=Undibacterium sp. TaxID=1914977 RepID=UPI00271F23D0|nr:outer membrane protein assembly factor BamB [Undibacterium sp.]MDO8653652.1 outer membrane protein assembly factor BamB [Undibacterium sp.]